tara:strand:- start:1560 stop:1775 length:216 start_codon:yes stop_codon:yes gene_type:complete
MTDYKKKPKSFTMRGAYIEPQKKMKHKKARSLIGKKIDSTLSEMRNLEFKNNTVRQKSATHKNNMKSNKKK